MTSLDTSVIITTQGKKYNDKFYGGTKVTDREMESKENHTELQEDQQQIPSQTIFTLLEDKNHTIKNLKKKLSAQKVQIQYYLKKFVENPEVIEMSKSCCPEIVEENIPLVLAMGNFKKDMGIKSKIYKMYEQMSDLYGFSKNTLKTQEFVLKKFFTHLCLLYGSRHVKRDLPYVINDPRQIGLMNNLLETTVDLKRILQHFKVSAERLIAIEDERNDVILQTLSITSDEKSNFYNLLYAKLENIQLQQQIEAMRKEKEEVLQLTNFVPINDKLLELQNKIETVFCSEESPKVNLMLIDLNDQAESLLAATSKTENELTAKTNSSTCCIQKETKSTQSSLYLSDQNVQKKQLFETLVIKLRKEHRVLVQCLKTKQEHIFNLKNLNRNLSDKINFLQAAINRQSDEIAKQNVLIKRLMNLVERSYDELNGFEKTEPRNIYTENVHVEEITTWSDSLTRKGVCIRKQESLSYASNGNYKIKNSATKYGTQPIGFSATQDYFEENELYKDVSYEQVPQICPPIKRQTNSIPLSTKADLYKEDNRNWAKKIYLQRQVSSSNRICIPFEKI